ncbi:MAG: methyl-accepting chemotaxis protein [Pseudomonadota bacterium]
MINIGNTTSAASAPDDPHRWRALQLAALSDVAALIEFEPDGTIRWANDNFLATVGYSLDEIVGQHHRLFVTDEYRESAEYRAFWTRLAAGLADDGEYLRVGKDKREIWLQASYAPIRDELGEVVAVVKCAADITERKLREANYEGNLKAISAVQAVIEFEPDGTIITANENFLGAVGYTLSQIQGQHHRMFVPQDIACSDEYRAFWQRLGAGQFDAGRYQRVANGGNTLWLQASYNPIFDPAGRVLKVVKYATDITAQQREAKELEVVLASVSGVMGKLVEGDLTTSMVGEFSSRFAGLQDAVNATVSKLRETVLGILQAADQIRVSAGDIAEGTSTLSQRTEQQAASLEETAASMEELTTTVQQTAQNAHQANELAANARSQAERGGEVVAETVSAMGETNTAASKIADIIGVIDEIAFQTNLLALNAAVEAARAGEQGRGFAVVASEVRNLAQRSAGAAKEIKALITDSVRKVEEGSDLVNQSGETLREIMESVHKTSDVIAEIASAASDQSQGIGDINRAVAEMDSNTQHYASVVSQSADASESMKRQAQALNELVAFFHIDAHEGIVPLRALRAS